MLCIHRVHPSSKCSMSGKTAMCVEMSEGRQDDAPVIISINSLTQLLRMQAAKAEAKSKRNNPPASSKES